MKINENWEAVRDTYGWQLKQWRDGVNTKTGEPTRTYVSSYHPNLEQCFNHIIDTDAGAAVDVDGYRSILHYTMKDIVKALGERRRRSRVVKVVPKETEERDPL